MLADAIRRCLARLHDDRGSMVIALLAVIVTSGLMLSVTASAIAGHRGVNFDRDHVRVVQGADAGVEEVIYKLGHPDPLQRMYPPAVVTEANAVQAGDARYWSEVEAIPGFATRWRVKSHAKIGDEVTRNVTAEVAQPQPFTMAAFADSHLVLRGGNSANSYGASWGTNRGVIGSNGTITLNGSVTADDSELHDYDAAPDPTRCISNGNSVCAGFNAIGPETDVTSAEALGFIDDVIDPAATAPTPYCPATKLPFTGTTLEARDQPYCFTTMTISADFTVTGDPLKKALVYLTNPGTAATFAVSNKAKVNCTGCTGTGGPIPDASRLQVFTKSVGPIRIGNHSHVAAAIFAPRATCGGNPSNAGANFYGSMVCAIITNQGAWSFHYDDRLSQVGVGGWTVRRWSEE